MPFRQLDILSNTVNLLDLTALRVTLPEVGLLNIQDRLKQCNKV